MSGARDFPPAFLAMVPRGGHADPYLLWAMLTHFQGYRGPLPTFDEATGLKVLVAFEVFDKKPNRGLLENATDWGIRPLAGTPFGTARLSSKDLPKLAKLVKRLELSMPVLAEWDTSPVMTVDGSPSPLESTELVEGSVMAVIDDGFAHGHREFRDAQNKEVTRVRYMWDQERRIEIIRNGVFADVLPHAGPVWEESVYLQQNLRGALKAFSHGTLVASLAGGRSRPGWRMERFGRVGGGIAGDRTEAVLAPADGASDCKLILVQFPRRTADDNSGSSLSAQTLSALSYIGSRCAPAANLVVNLSYGPAAGPHDGSSLLEAALDAFIKTRGELKTAVVVPAGNQYQSRGHACIVLDPDGTQQLKWRVLPDDATESFVEIWIPEDGQISVQLIPPNSKAMDNPWVALGELGGQFWPDAPDPQCAVIAAPLNAKGKGRMVLVALGPTATQVPRRPASHGTWKINIKNDNAKEVVTVHAWIQRDDPTLSAVGRGGRQSYFEDASYKRFDKTGRPQWEDDEEPCAVQRNGSFSPIATGHRTLRVGAYRLSDGATSPYSGGGGGLPAPVDPDLAAVAEESVAIKGIFGAGTRGNSMVRGNGTSVAAPQLARRLLTLLNGQLTRERLIQKAINSKSGPNTMPTPRRGQGNLSS